MAAGELLRDLDFETWINEYQEKLTKRQKEKSVKLHAPLCVPNRKSLKFTPI